MSYNPHMNYVSSTYYEEPEGFVADYSDSDAIPDNQKVCAFNHGNCPQNHSRNYVSHNQQQIMHSQKRYHQQQALMPQCKHELCFDKKMSPRPPPHPPHLGSPTYPTYQAYPVYEYRHSQFCPMETMTPPKESAFQNSYNQHGYNRRIQRDVSSQQYACRNVQDINQHTQQKAPVKRYPVTVGTPKFYRKPSSANSIYKRPSALCLPVASQPDPAVVRKPKKSNSPEINNQPSNNNQQEPPNVMSEEITEELSHKMDSEGDFSLRIANLEDMLDRMEKNELPHKVKSKSEIAKISKFLKPRIPSSVKARQEKLKQKSSKHSECSASSLNYQKNNEEDEGLDSLDKLLNQLKKCELAATSLTKDAEETVTGANTISQGNEAGDGADDEGKKNPSVTKSFNYQDITSQINRTQEELKVLDSARVNSTRVNSARANSARASSTSIQEISKKIKSLSSSGSCGRPRSRIPKPPLDDHCALELHRSKSYIVNLIDRALSKELGTVPGERARREFDNMSTKKAVDLVNRHTHKSEKDLSVEITSALTESIISNATAPEDDLEEQLLSKGKICCCSGEEPSYIKQLKQLRWGHLKHIQREVRRLEDLERFLDSCSITTIPEN